MTDKKNASDLSDEQLDDISGGPTEMLFGAYHTDLKSEGSEMTQSDLDNGRMIAEVGVAPLKPAEFVVFRIGQKTADAGE